MLRKLIGKLLGTSKKSETKPAAGAIPARAHAPSHGGTHAKPRGDSRGPAHPQDGPRAPARKDQPRDDRGSRGPQSRDHSQGGRGHGPAKQGGHSSSRGPAHEGQHGRGPRAEGDASAPQQQRSSDSSSGSSDRPQRSRSERGGGGGGDRGRGRGHGSSSGSGRGREHGGGDRGHGRGGRGHHDSQREQRLPSEDMPLITSDAAPRAAGAAIEIPPISSDNEFSDLGLEPFIAAAVESLGFTLPTPIQSEAIPMILAGRDVIGSAQTGTGKTAAFGLPILQKLAGHGPLRCLVLEPTRELALQVDEAFRTYSKFTDLRTAVIFGGVGYGPQKEALSAGLDIVVATPGRLLDHMEQGTISLKDIHFLILDEVDRMLDMGFLPDVKRIIEKVPKDRQTLFFSATIPPELEKLTSWVLREPHTISIGRRRSPAETVSHAFYPVIEPQKFDLLKALLEQTNYESVLIFCRTKHGADFVANRLESQGHKVAVMHSNRSQTERMDALKGFKSGKYEVMVATDVAARGLDIAGISHVINFDVPLHAEDYVHRIGRTGRAQAEGDAFTLLTEEETKYAASIEHFIGVKVERKKLENFPYQYSAVFASLEGGAKNIFRSRLYRGTRG